MDFVVTCLLTGGLSSIVALCFLEKLVPVLPSYVLLVLFGLATVDDAADLAETVLASAAGSVFGALVWYGFGRLVGAKRCESLVDRYGRYILLPGALYRRLAAAYARHHFLVTMVGQTIPTARIYLALPAGVIGLSFVPFVLATLLGTLAWNAPLITVGYLLRGTGWSPGTVGVAVAVILLSVEAVVFLAVARTRAPLSRVRAARSRSAAPCDGR